jgi:hypothetical protein
MLHKYLLRRGNSYYFRWRIPADLRPVFGMTELICSLRTFNQLLASVRAEHFLEAVAGIKRAREAYLAQEIDTAVYVSKLKKHWVDVRSMARKKTLIKTGLIEYLGMTFDYDGDVDKELSALVKAKELDIFPQTEKHKKPERVSEIIFSVLFENFLAHKMDTVIARKEGRNPLTEKIQKQYHRDFTILIEIMGDIPISSITRKMLEGSILTFGELPKRNIKPYNKMPIVELLEMEIPDDHRVSSKVPDEVRRLVQGIFRYALDQEFIQVSPARDLNLKLTSSRTFASYSKNEIVSLLLACGKEDDMSWKRWIPFLAAYTGARLG